MLASRQDDGVENRAPMAGCGGKHAAMPDGVLEPKATPNMKDDAGRIQQSPDGEQEKRRERQRLQDDVVDGEDAPAKKQIKKNREPVEPAWQHQLQSRPEERHGPNPDQQA